MTHSNQKIRKKSKESPSGIGNGYTAVVTLDSG